MKSLSSLLWLCLVAWFSSSQAHAQANNQGTAGSWKAGFAKTAITPDRPMWMSGYASRNKPATGTLHDLWAKAVALEDPQGNKVILITLDLVGIDRDTSSQIRTQIARAAQMDPGSICINCSHTHCGPVVGQNLRAMYFLGPIENLLVDKYTKNLIDTSVSVARRALLDLTPARISHGMGNASFAVNRRNNKEADVPKIREAGELKGPVDHAVPVLVVQDLKGNLRGLVCEYACHATTLDSYEWCGDYPGFGMLELEKRHPGAMALFCAGCGADQNPLPRRKVELAKQYGNQLADAVDKVLAVTTPEISGTLRSQYKEIPLGYAELPTREKLFEMSISMDRYQAARGAYLLQKMMVDRKLDETYPYPIQVWHLGTGPVWVHLGGEVTVEYSLRLKAENKGKTLWVDGYSNDVMAYIPSTKVLKDGGYEGATSMVYYGLPSTWAPAIEEQIITAANGLIK